MKLFLKCLTLMTLLALFCCAFVWAEASGDPDVTVIASGECGAEGDNLTWSLASNGQLTVSGTGEMQDFEDTPAPWSGYASSISSLVIENGATHIGVSAFAGLGQLQNAVIPDSITVIGSQAFASCGSLLGIAFPESQLRIEAQAFQSCNALTSVTLPAGLQRVEPDAFESCRNLTSITIDEGNAAYNSVNGVLYVSGGMQLMICPAGFSGSFTVPAGTRM
ncbi:MAG: leucine-rich repeat domain-containing protein, partial [Clostridia bacterium]|nr:leucine-rich repeat domain-containing protein [Clostridia bacterium]